MFNEDLSKQICKIGGPFVLLICCPIIFWLSYYVFKKAIDDGEIVTTRNIVEIGLVNIFCIFVGIISTYKGYENRFRKK